MGFEAEEKALKGAFLTGWAANQSTYPAKYDGSPKIDTSGAYVIFSVLPGDGARLELGDTGNSRWVGIVIVQIFVPEAGGVRVAGTVGDLVKAIFHDQQFTTDTGGKILCRQTSLRRAGQEGARIQYNAVTPFQRDEA